MTTVFVPGPRIGMAFLTAWIAVRPASASAAIEGRVQRRVELERPSARSICSSSSEAAVATDPRERSVDAVHVVPRAGTVGRARRR